MASHQQTAQLPIAPHYFWVQSEFCRLRDKLEAGMMRPVRPMGMAVVDGSSALKIWEQGLRRTRRRLPGLLHTFSNTILAGSRRPSPVDRQGALIPLEQEVNHLLALYRQLWQHSLGHKQERGQVLLAACIEKIGADLHDLFTFFITTVAAHAAGQQPGRSTYVYTKEIACRAEMAEYQSWWLETSQPLSVKNGTALLSRFVHSLIAGGRGSLVSGLMG